MLGINASPHGLLGDTKDPIIADFNILILGYTIQSMTVPKIYVHSLHPSISKRVTQGKTLISLKSSKSGMGKAGAELGQSSSPSATYKTTQVICLQKNTGETVRGWTFRLQKRKPGRKKGSMSQVGKKLAGKIPCGFKV